MLIITRRVGESFRIGDDVIVEIKQARGDATKLGIEAPKDTSVHREEKCKKSLPS